VIARYDYDREVVSAARKLFLNSEAIEPRHAEVQHNTLRPSVSQRFQKVDTRLVLSNCVAAAAQDSCDCIAHVRIIINESDQRETEW